jgi:membrane-bound serine protease (ClpP class)
MNALIQRLVVILGVALVGMTGRAVFAAPAEEGAQPGQSVAIVSLNGEIDDYTRANLLRRFEQAKATGAKVIIVDIDSTGGLVTSSLEISHFLKRQDDVRTIAFVRDKAYSGAAMVALACSEIWMAPESVLGDCAPIVLGPGGLKALPAAERAKMETPIVKDFEDSANRNGYSPVLARAMVSVEKSAYFLEDGAGHRKIVDEGEYKQLSSGGEWQPVAGYDSPIDGPNTLLTVYTDEAIALGLARGKAASAQALAGQLNYRLVADLTPGLGEKTIEALNTVPARFLVLLIFLLAMYVAMSTPGHGVPEALALIGFGVLVGVPLLTGYAQLWEVVVIFVGLALCAFEIFVFPGHFVSIIVGLLMMVFGLVMTFSGKEPGPNWLPTMQTTWHGIENGLISVLGATISWFFLFLWLRRYLPKIPYFSGLILTATAGDSAISNAPTHVKEVWPFLGTVGVSATDLRPGGSAEFPFGDEKRTAAVVSLSGYIPAGTKLIVEQIEGSSVRVKALKAQS